ncbi:hypothetical protein SADUNF_Sadunf10G0037000 [Salix dunnii]|uniref:Serine-threonine protein phosphatase N-terminal domain-containing protein n=1 Tax=Salix dunnii TaxID=1413687 RepID=A0A835JLQ9_9ROSI|nr:hypothetical protein SADUNF_Sadunf10G0037000 [Salix dunnii]
MRFERYFTFTCISLQVTLLGRQIPSCLHHMRKKGRRMISCLYQGGGKHLNLKANRSSAATCDSSPFMCRLLEVGGNQVQLSEADIRQLCTASREIFLKQPDLLELAAPISICGSRFPIRKDRPTCSHCGISGHTVDKCYKVHGFPPGYKFTKGKNAFPSVQQVSGTPQLPITYEQCQQLLSMLKPDVAEHDSSINQVSSFNLKNWKTIGVGREDGGLYYMQQPVSVLPKPSASLIPAKSMTTHSVHDFISANFCTVFLADKQTGLGAQEWVLYVTGFDNQVHLAISQNLRTFWDHIAS